MNGLLVVDKPSGPTSHDVVARARRAFRMRAVGHTGTLDPMATGVLLLVLGEARKLVPYLVGADKEYRARIQLGTETDTLDAQGETCATEPVPPFDRERLEHVIAEWVGPMQQRPPRVSALKIHGQRSHRLARQGQLVEPAPRPVTLYACSAIGLCASAIDLELRCSTGFYVRSLARDLARALGTVGHLSSLRRTRVGRFTLQQAVPLDDIERAACDGGDAATCLKARVLPLELGVEHLVKIGLTVEGARQAYHGRPIHPVHCAPAAAATERDAASAVALLSPDGTLLALGRREGEVIRVTRGIR